jgi:lipopolysaccharide exporter
MSGASPAAGLDVGRSLVRGSAWMVALRWGLRVLGLVNTFILARLLTPADFGLVAMAMVVIGLIEVLGQTGQNLALIRHVDPTREHFDSVWTLGILIAAGLTALLWAVAPLAAWYFHEPRARDMIELLALRTLLGGFQNVGVVAFRRELRFDRDFAYQFLQRTLVVGVTIACALWLRDWRALAAGILGGQVLGVASSYLMHPYRPRLCVRRIREILAFSGWMLAVNLAQYVNGRADQFVVGGIAGPAAMGLYNVAADAGTAPAMEITLPVARALFPVFAKIRDDAAAVRTAFLDLFAAVCMVSIAVGLGTALVAEDFVAVALGPRWGAAVPLVRLLAIAGGLYGIMQAAIPVMSALGHARLSAEVTASRAASMVAAVAAAAALGDIETIAWARTLITLVFIPGIFLAIARVMPVSLGDMASRGWRPLAAGAVMAAVVLAAHAAVPAIPALRLLTDSAAGAASYAAALLLLWWLAGRPGGLEAALVARVRRRLAPRRG